MAKETVDKNVALIRKLVATKGLIIGTERVVKALKLDLIEKVFIASNCTERIEEDLEYYCKLTKAKVVKLNYPNDELGVVCKKPFSISVIGIEKSK